MRAPERRAGAGLRSVAVGVSIFMVGLLSVGCGGQPPVAERTPNIVLVSIDTLRADHLQSYGYGRRTAPAVARLAASGVRFSHALSQAPWTLPSMASLHTSLYPVQHGAVTGETALPEGAETLAERLRSLGYGTVAVVSHQFVAAKHGFAQGFDVFDERNVRGHEAVTSRDLTLAALTRLGEVSEPFFLWIHYFDPHFTYVRHSEIGFADDYDGSLPDELTAGLLIGKQRQPVSAADLEYIEAVYDEEIAHTDDWIGKLRDTLVDRYGEEDTVWVITADHGEYFLERGRFFHGQDVYDALVHVPLVIGGDIDAGLRGRVVSRSVETRSIPKTVLGILGAETTGFGGDDLLEVARGGASSPVFSEGSSASPRPGGRSRAVVRDRWKLIERLDEGGFELYDLSADPAERDNLYAALAVRGEGRVAALHALLRGFVELPRLEPRSVGLTDEEIEGLRALGYIR